MSGFTFDLDRQPPENPMLSVLCVNKNHGEYIEDTLLSVLSQKFDDFEFIISDGGSTDNSLDLIARHKFITLLPGADTSPKDGLDRVVAAARGRYVMFTTTTDGFLSRDWFKLATSALDNNPQVSMVYGATAMMSPEGTLEARLHFPNAFHFHEQPQLQKFAEVWLFKGIHSAYLPELNYCMRLDMFRQLMGPSVDFPELDSIETILRVHFRFNQLGYLAYYLPVFASFNRIHPNQLQFNEENVESCGVYEATWNKYRDDVMSGRREHMLRDAQGQILAKVSLGTPPP